MRSRKYRRIRVLQSVELAAPAEVVWNVVGGFYTIHLWHPDIQRTEVPADQTQVGPLRRILTFPGQPKTVEELLIQNNEQRYYRYKWHAGAWGEKVKDYVAELRVFELSLNSRSIVQWSSAFSYFEDALSEFYWNGFRALQKRFPTTGKRKSNRARD